MISMEIEIGIPLIHQPMEPLHKEVPGLCEGNCATMALVLTYLSDVNPQPS